MLQDPDRAHRTAGFLPDLVLGCRLRGDCQLLDGGLGLGCGGFRFLRDGLNGLGFRLEGDIDWTSGFQSVTRISQSESKSTWKPVWGERASTTTQATTSPAPRTGTISHGRIAAERAGGATLSPAEA